MFHFLNKPLCWIVGKWRSLFAAYPVDGCDYVNEEEDVPALVTTSKCEICGKYSISWKRQ